MSQAETERLAPASPSSPVPLITQHEALRTRKRGAGGKLIALLILVIAGGAFALSVTSGRISLHEVWEVVKHQLPLHLLVPKVDPASIPIEIEPTQPWDGAVTIGPKEREAIGLRFARVLAQSQPLKLSLTGRTAYDENSLTRIRPRFDTLVEKVYASPGQKVKKGDPLVDLYSIELAAAKTDYQTKYVQWQHDLKLYELHQNLIKSDPPAISQQLLVDSQIAENKSRLDYIAARDNLGILGVPAEEIAPLIRGLNADQASPIPDDSLRSKAKMTLRSPADGIVIEREVVPGNLYNDTFVLMVIAPLDHLFVWVNVYERDQAKVAIGQRMEIFFPFLEEHVDGTVQYISSEVAKDTRAVKIRASVANPGGLFKADMLVRAALEIPPVAGQTVIPRIAMVVANGSEYVFVRDPSAGASKEGVDRFERRKITVAQEGSEDVVVSKDSTPEKRSQRTEASSWRSFLRTVKSSIRGFRQNDFERNRPRSGRKFTGSLPTIKPPQRGIG
jgi:cobalt-zinc-cadmium efflux system membrane fusion protein